MNKRIFIYGVPGSGKTHLTEVVCKESDYSHFELDDLRSLAQEGKTLKTDPFLFLGTTEAYKYLDIKNEESIIWGLRKVRETMAPYIEAAIKNKTKQLIIEGAFIDPAQYSKENKVYLIVKPDEIIHREHFFKHRERNEANEESFKVARIIQEYLMEEAKNLPVETVTDLDQMVIR